jgi:hypothetical protein
MSQVPKILNLRSRLETSTFRPKLKPPDGDGHRFGSCGHDRTRGEFGGFGEDHLDDFNVRGWLYPLGGVAVYQLNM